MKTPADLVIEPREIAFGRDEPHPRWWLAGDPVATAFYNALSITFPLGERFFMDAVRHYRDRTPPVLQGQIGAFLKQEAMHSREHVFFNKQLTDHGYDIRPAEKRLEWRINLSRKAPHAVQLCATAALEHFTAIMAHEILREPRHFEGCAEEASRMWRWHAMEEIEHKAVAFDTYVTAVRGGPVGRWLLRTWVMMVATLLFTYTITRNVIDLLRQDGINTPRTWARTMAYLWGSPGLLRSIVPAYFAYYRPGFHPWEVDDRDLLAPIQGELAAG